MAVFIWGMVTGFFILGIVCVIGVALDILKDIDRVKNNTFDEEDEEAPKCKIFLLNTEHKKPK